MPDEVKLRHSQYKSILNSNILITLMVYLSEFRYYDCKHKFRMGWG